MHTLDGVQVEPKIQTEQAQTEMLTNLAWDQGNPWCITPHA
jgi:hypothetical protein